MAAQTLKSLCLHIDGALTFTFALVSEVLEEALRNKPETTLSPQLAQICEKSSFVHSATLEAKVETCFLVLSILSHLIKRRAEIL